MALDMPRPDGFGATRAILELAPAGPRPRIVAVTADALEGTRERCLDDHLGKPGQLEVLLGRAPTLSHGRPRSVSGTIDR